MTPPVARRHARAWRCLIALLLLAPAWFPAGRVSAGDPPPPPATLRVPLSTVTPAQPAAGQAVLYEQMSPADIQHYFILSQNSTNDSFDARAADDFFTTSGTASWHITAVEVAGLYDVGSSSVSSVNVEFYADAGGLPGYRLYTANATPISGTAATGNYYLPLSPPVDLAANAHYWVSVQAIQSVSSYWYWGERTAQTLHPAVWYNPSEFFSDSCASWTPIVTCSPGTGPDLLFRLYGTQSTSQVTPVLLSLNPYAAIHRTFTLNAFGVGFANGAVINWTRGVTTTISATVSNSSQLSAIVSAALVPGPYNATVTVSVKNPGPCLGSCTSNKLTFTMADLLFLPLARR